MDIDINSAWIDWSYHHSIRVSWVGGQLLNLKYLLMDFRFKLAAIKMVSASQEHLEKHCKWHKINSYVLNR
jgi:hypothetical protein